MKQPLIIVLTLLVALGAIFGTYYYINHYTKPQSSSAESQSLTTAAPNEPTSSAATQDTLLAELPDADYHLYLNGTTVKLVHDGQTNEFTNWSRYIDMQPPELTMCDINADGKDELIIRLVSGIDDRSKEYVFDLYILFPEKKEDGKYDYGIEQVNNETWLKIFDSSIHFEISNLKTDKSRIQIAMDTMNHTIAYNEKTGIADCQYLGFARCLRSNDDYYYNISQWFRGNGIITLEGKKKTKIGISIPIYVYYDDTTAIQVVGNAHIALTYKDNKYAIAKKSIYFTAADEYKVSDPRTTAAEPWSYSIENTAAPASSTDLLINWIDASFDIDSTKTDNSMSFSTLESEIKSVDSINITDSSVSLTADYGYKFAASYIKSNNYSVIINKGTDTEYSISTSAKIETDATTGMQTLVLILDKSYPKEEISTISISYGS